MAGIWFAKENTLGRLEGPVTDKNAGIYFGSNRRLYFYALIYIDSSNADKNIPLLTALSDSNNSPSRYKTRIYCENSQIKVYGTRDSTLVLRGYCDNVIPMDELVEIVVQGDSGGGSNAVNIYYNGVAQSVSSKFGRYSIFDRYTQVILGGDTTATGNAKGVLISKLVITDDWDSPPVAPPLIPNSTGVVWTSDFEDVNAPLKIKGQSNSQEYELVWTNTDATNVVWTDTNAPPSSGRAGGIIIPGNGNTTRIQGTVMEDDLPVARQVFAITQAQLAVDGSQETKHAVLNSVLSDSISGSYSLDTSPYEGAVIVVATDNYGEVWQGDAVYEVGDVIRPADFQGYVYLCTVSGIGDSTEPTWWFDDSVQAIGTAQFKAKPYTRPLAHGPVTPEIVPES
ncbi:hypothetical protein [Endozoicomonas sp. 2B-B]